MTLREQLAADLKAAMKARDELSLGVLRMVVSAVNAKEMEAKGKGAFGEPEVLAVLMNESKKRKESMRLFREGNRSDLAEQEERELSVIAKYLPQQLSAAEVEARVKGIIEKSGARDFPSAMKAAMAELRGSADSKDVTDAVKKMLRS
jgi:uncharacterized protein YqeY